MQVPSKKFTDSLIEQAHQVIKSGAHQESEKIMNEIRKNLILLNNTEEKIKLLNKEIRVYQEVLASDLTPQAVKIRELVQKQISEIKSNPEKYFGSFNSNQSEVSQRKYLNFCYGLYNYIIELIITVRKIEAAWLGEMEKRNPDHSLLSEKSSELLIERSKKEEKNFLSLYSNNENANEHDENRILKISEILNSFNNDIENANGKENAEIFYKNSFLNCIQDLLEICNELETSYDNIESEIIKSTANIYFKEDLFKTIQQSVSAHDIVKFIKDEISTTESSKNYVTQPDVENLAISKIYHRNLKECYDILKGDIIVDTDFEVFEGVFKEKRFIKPITFNKAITNQEIRYFFTEIEDIMLNKNRWERVVNCCGRDGDDSLNYESLRSPGVKNPIPEGKLTTLNRAISTLKNK